MIHPIEPKDIKFISPSHITIRGILMQASGSKPSQWSKNYTFTLLNCLLREKARIDKLYNCRIVINVDEMGAGFSYQYALGVSNRMPPPLDAELEWIGFAL